MGCIVAMCACVNARISLDCVTARLYMHYSAYANVRITHGYTQIFLKRKALHKYSHAHKCVVFWHTFLAGFALHTCMNTQS